MAWYFQSSPHDTHDWDATQTPVLFDGDDQRPAAQAARAGVAQRQVLRARSHRRQGHRLVRVRHDELVARLRREGPADPESGEASADRRRARDAEPGRRDATGSRRASARRPGLFYVSAAQRLQRLATSTTPGDNPQGWGGTDRGGWSQRRWCRRSTTRPARSAGATSGKAAACSGSLSTAGNLLFTGDGSSGELRRAERHDGRSAVARRRPQRRSATVRSPTRWTACSMSSSAPATRCGRSS